jgi:hypothetical protein
MGLAIAVPTITAGVDLDNIKVPTLLVAGGQDHTSPQLISECVIGVANNPSRCPARLGSVHDNVIPDNVEKAFVVIPNAVHRSFDSTYCDQLQAAGAIAEANGDAILDRQTVTGIVAPVGSSALSGTAMDYCSPATFTDIWPLVNAITKTSGPTDVPTTGLDTDEVKQGVADLAATFFGTVLKRSGGDGTHFTRYLAPKWLEKHEPMVGSAEAFAGSDAICPPGQEVVCAD